MIDKTLLQEQGLTHDVFKPPEVKEGEGDAEPKDENAEGQENQEPKEPEKKIPNHIYIQEVVREKRMHFFKVPRLGSYLAVELKYESCLSEEAFDKAFVDFLECEEKRTQQEKEKQDYLQDIQDQKDQLGDEYKEPEEPKTWPEIAEKPYETVEKKYVICLDTMGQDREFTEEQKEFVFDAVQNYSDTWTLAEKTQLREDLKMRLDIHSHDKDYFDGDLAQSLLADEEKYIDDYFDSLEEPADEATRNEKLPVLKHEFLQKKLIEGDWRNAIDDFKKYRVIKFTRFWQSLFYFLGCNREDICEEGTNKLFWKKAQNRVGQWLSENMGEYTHSGPKEKEFKKYQKINFIEKNIDGINIEDIEQYSFPLSRLFKWLTTKIEMRKDDIIRRKEIKEKEREERDQALEDHKEWKSKREAAMEDAKVEFEAKLAEEEAAKQQQEEGADEPKPEGEQEQEPEEKEKPVFNEEEFYKHYDEENPEVVIPPDVIDDIDNDYDIAKEGDE